MANTNLLKTLMENPLVIGLIYIAVTVYGHRLSPKLPAFITNAFNSSFFRFGVLLIIIFIGNRDIRVSMVLAILFMILLSIVNNQNLKEDFEQQINEYYVNYNLFQSREHMTNNGSPEMEDEENNPHVMVEYFDSPPASDVNNMPATAMAGQTDEEEAKKNAMEHMVNPVRDEKEEVRQASDINKSLVKEDALKNINRIAQDKRFQLSDKCKTFFSDLENTGAKCFNEFITEARNFNNSSDSNVNALAASARQRASAI
jgi:hypothetical protein